MDLSALGSTLPPGLADAEREMGDKFRASALSITTLYKASLGATKQAYSVGYSAALADVLATVQSSLTAGQDSSTALSRLMDWAEAREAAIAAFATDEGEDQAPLPKPAPLPRQVSTLAHPHVRSASAPVPEHVKLSSTPQPAASTSAVGSLPNRPKLRPEAAETNPPYSGSSLQGAQGDISVSRAMLASTNPSPVASSSTSTPFSKSTTQYQPTPQNLLSSPVTASTSIPRYVNHSNRPSKNLPLKYNVQSSPSTSTATSPIAIETRLPSSTFNPTIPPIPFTINSQQIEPGGLQPSQSGNLGSKRPLIETDMMDDIAPTSSTVAPHLPPQQQLQQQQPLGSINLQPKGERGRSAKRRSVAKDEEKEDRTGERDRRKGGRRHGPA